MRTRERGQFSYTYKVTVDAGEYLPEDGYPFSAENQTSNAFERLLDEALPIVFDIVKNIFIYFMASMHHGHARPTNPGQITTEQRIRRDVILERHYKYDVIKKRHSNIYTPVEITEYGHTETPSQKRANAWLVSFDSPEEIKKNNRQPHKDNSFLCFSANEAEQINRNIHTVMAATSTNVFFPLPEGENIKAMYSNNDNDPIYNAQLKRLNAMKSELQTTFDQPKSLLKRIAEKLLRRPALTTNILFPHLYFRKYAIIEASNPQKNNAAYRQALDFVSIDSALHQRHLHNQKYAAEINLSISKIEKEKIALIKAANAYLQTHLEDYIAHKFKIIDQLSEENNVLLLPSLKAKESILAELKQIDYIQIYRTLPKHERFFTVEFNHFNDIMDKKLFNGNMNDYLSKKLDKFRP